jgi:thioredoxin 1
MQLLKKLHAAERNIMEAPDKKSGPSIGIKIGVLFLLAAAIAGVIIIKQARNADTADPSDKGQSEEQSPLPKLLEVGSTTCTPCKMMKPVLEELGKEYKGKLSIEIIDVEKDKDAKELYNIKVIPTQIFYNAEGKEIFRHIGFFSKEDIINKWKELGINLDAESLEKPTGKIPVDPTKPLPASGKC